MPFRILRHLGPIGTDTETAREKRGCFSVLTAGKHVPPPPKCIYLFDIGHKRDLKNGSVWSAMARIQLPKVIGRVAAYACAPLPSVGPLDSSFSLFLSLSSLLFFSFILL